jgi:hypothetical protein
MKELVPAYTNPEAHLNEILEGLRKYGTSADPVVGAKVNRQLRIEFDNLSVDDLPVAEVWLFGATQPDESRWSLFGRREGKWVKWDAIAKLTLAAMHDLY